MNMQRSNNVICKCLNGVVAISEKHAMDGVEKVKVGVLTPPSNTVVITVQTFSECHKFS